MDDETLTNYPGPANRTAHSDASDLNLAGSETRSSSAPARPSEELPSGTTIGGYRVVRRIAEGGMGAVYEAVQLKLDRHIALKILSDRLALEPEFMQRFEREAKAAAALNHPNVVQVHDFGQSDGRHFLAMEYVEGEDLSTHIRDHGKLAVNQALDLIEQAASALQAAAAKAIIHRDIKPSNLILTKNGRVKVADLGLARILNEASDMTMTGVTMGSPHFMAPEQAEDPRQVDHRADIYSLGITLLFLLTGKRPYEGGSAFSVVLAHASKPLPSGADLGAPIPPPVEGLIQRMAAKNPADRYENYDALLADIARVKQGFAPVPKRRPASLTRRYFGVGILIVAFACMVAALFMPLFTTGKLPGEKTTTAVATPPFRGEREPNSQRPPGDEPFRRRPPFRGPREGGPDDGPRFGPRFPPPMPPMPFRNMEPLERGSIDSMLAKADEFAKNNPSEFIEIINRYRQVKAEAEGGPKQPEIDTRIETWISRHQEAVGREFQRFEQRMHEKLRAGQVHEAYNVWRDFPTKLRARNVDMEIVDLLMRALPPDFTP